VLVCHGVSDPIFSIDDSKQWYDGMKSRSGGDNPLAATLTRVKNSGVGRAA
jgi:hypothetical protein